MAFPSFENARDLPVWTITILMSCLWKSGAEGSCDEMHISEFRYQIKNKETAAGQPAISGLSSDHA